MLLVDLPLFVLQLIILELEGLDPSFQSVLNLSFCHPAFSFFVTGRPANVVSFARPVVSHVAICKTIFTGRCLHILDGIYEHPRWACSRMRGWLDHVQNTIGRLALAEIIFRIVRLDFIELLCGSEPPTLEQVLALSEPEAGNFFAVYICLVKILHDDSLRHYIGSGTNQLEGFIHRQRVYLRPEEPANFCQLPEFIRNLRFDNVDYEILTPIPILRIPAAEREDFEHGDIRVLVLLIEAVIMYWWRSIRPGTVYDKVMEYSPWTDDDLAELDWSGGNRKPSTYEFPDGVPKTLEQIELSKEEAKARRKTENLESEKREIRNQKARESYQDLPEEEKETRRQSMRDRRANMTAEQREERNERERFYVAKRTPERKAEIARQERERRKIRKAKKALAGTGE